MERSKAAEALPAQGGHHLERLWVRHGERIVMIRVAELEAVLAAGNYVELVAGGQRHLLRVTLSETPTEFGMD